MATFATFETTPNLGVHTYPSAALYRVIRQNLLALDEATRQGRPAFSGGALHPQEYVTSNPYREAWGAFRALPGLTTLTTAIYSTGVTSGDVLRVYVDDVLTSTHTLANGTSAFTTTLGSYTTNSVHTVQWDIYNATKPQGEAAGAVWGNFELVDAYVGPVTLADSYPGVTSFAGSYSASALSSLASSVDWLARRVGRRTEPLFTTLVRWLGPYTGQLNVRWHGGLIVSPAAPTLVATVAVRVTVPGATEQVILAVNDSAVQTWTVPNTPGNYGHVFSYAMPQAAGTRIRVAVGMTRSGTPPHTGAEPCSRLSVMRVACTGDRGVYSALSIPDVTARSSMTWATWKAALNACVSAATTIKARIDANPDLWDRQRLFRRRYAYDDAQNRWYEPGQPAFQLSRMGEAVLVRGQANRINYGIFAVDEDPKKENEVGLPPFEGTKNQGVTEGASLRTELVYLDTVPGLRGAMPYAVRGVDLVYAGEILLVGQDVT